jgi:hypothetical protein
VLDELRRQHDVSLWAFDAEWRRVGQWDRRNAGASGDDPAEFDANEFEPVGGETRLGDALAATLAEAEGGPLAGVVVLSDGGQNRGVDPLAMTDALLDAEAPLAAVGVGSTAPRRNVRIQELIAPSRAYPDDPTLIRALVQGEGYAGRTVTVELLAREGSPDDAATQVGVAEATFKGEDDTVEVEFQLTPESVGTLALEARLEAPADDQYGEDNRRTVEVEVVDRATRVLLVASGATRDYRFLRNQLRRDRHATIDVLLQGAPEGISQDADTILSEFPSERDEMFKYDCVVAFDPDWTQLESKQINLLEEWVSQEAGGMIVVAGPINVPAWVQNPLTEKIVDMYPVEFPRRFTVLDDGLFGSEKAWPIEFTREGQEADFLWLGDTSQESRENWARFPGVFGCYSVRRPKPGAQVYGRFGDPGPFAEGPVYFAEHFYGAGRVFYMGSGELWRLRGVDPGFFEILYTQLVRHVSEGRLLRGSSFGRLLVERDRYLVGDTVVVRAQLSNATRTPYEAPSVQARVYRPGLDAAGSSGELELKADESRLGNFVGQFSVTSEGAYRIELAVPDAPEELLVERLTADVPDLEFDDTRRNEPLLVALASRTGGRYYESPRLAVEGASGVPGVVELFPSRAETSIREGKPDKAFTERVNRGLLGMICGALCLEWLLRRLLKLA